MRERALPPAEYDRGDESRQREAHGSENEAYYIGRRYNGKRAGGAATGQRLLPRDVRVSAPDPPLPALQRRGRGRRGRRVAAAPAAARHPRITGGRAAFDTRAGRPPVAEASQRGGTSGPLGAHGAGAPGGGPRRSPACPGGTDRQGRPDAAKDIRPEPREAALAVARALRG